jgi:hypothetical protein
MNSTAQKFESAPPAAVAVGRHSVPLAAKVAYTLFVAALIPVYLHEYGPTNFLWFCDCALLLTLPGIWLESSLLVSACAVGILIPQFLWLIDFGSGFLGLHLAGLTDYMFDRKIPIFIRGLSLFHGWLPLVLLWLLGRLGYDKRALPTWTIIASALVLICYLFTPPAGTHLSDPNIPVNLNYVFGWSDKVPQQILDPRLYAVLWLATLCLVFYLPTHLLLKKIFHPCRPASRRYSPMIFTKARLRRFPSNSP